MFNLKVLLKFFDTGHIHNNLLLILLVSLIPFGEILLIFYVGEILGIYLVLATAAATGLLGFIVVSIFIGTLIKKIKSKIKKDEFPGREFYSLAGMFLCSICLIAPGFISDIAGLMLFFPFIRNCCGSQIVKKTEIPTKELYEYLKLYEA